MNVIVNIDSQKFSLNGIPYFKNFTSHVANPATGKVRIVNVYDSKLQLTDFEDFTQYSVNGVVHSSLANLISALLPVIYSRNTLGTIFVGNADRLLSVGATTVVENDVTIASASALIQGNIYTDADGETFNVPFAAIGKIRIDLVIIDASSQMTLLSGDETDSGNIAVPPFNLIAAGAIIVQQINVTENDFAFITPPVPYYEEFVWEEGPQTFEVPLGTIVRSVYHNRTKLFRNEYTVEDNIVTVDYVEFDPSETNIITIEN
ncbi:hypothetical protein [Flavobacterium sedimenticola]|uniref:Uncharacterized protein n=1 Tax=Flavobacterium sedimenticola TaxID=3043286 RepID=A0ABT6XMJ5_9FLAO|nr:hypothetical protein [Flavobacterium sedimenticola]MDI9256316.1 hypothetical protein [Flavobacterium sedimenticola]